VRLVVDCRYVTPGRHNGISRYTAGLVHALADLHPLTMLISDERQLAHLPAGSRNSRSIPPRSGA